MDYLNEIHEELKNIDPSIIDQVRLLERVYLFSKLRNLIQEKDSQNDQIAADILGWAYERLSED